MLNLTKHTLESFTNQIVTIKTILYAFLISICVGCSSLSFKKTKKNLQQRFQSQNFTSQHTGFLAVDLLSNDTLFNKNASKYFIPASTTKLFTFYTSLQLLDNSLPALKYSIDGNNIEVLGTGDPTWLHPYFRNREPINFLKRYDSIFVHLDNYKGEKLGPGWAWEDYPYYFSPEMTTIPLYGNVVLVETQDSLIVEPKYFRPSVTRKNNQPLRDWKENQFHIPKESKDTLHIPYITSKGLTLKLLAGETQNTVQLIGPYSQKRWNVLKGISRDSVLKEMLWESDNFLAEQLMLLSSSTLSDTLDFKKARDFIIEHHLKDITKTPRWVDGSGLSRYNLFTPNSMVKVLEHLYRETDSIQLFSLMPQWGLDGTLSPKEAKETPSFIFAKSGSMGNISNLCGYLKTKSGKLLAFSFMNNHFRRPSREVRKDMYDILTTLHFSY